MGGYYDEIEIEDMTWDDVKKVFHYPCPCGDHFEISKGQLRNFEDIATCPSCSLIIRVIYDPLDFEDDEEEDDEAEADSVEEDAESAEPVSDQEKGGLEGAMKKLTIVTETVIQGHTENSKENAGGQVHPKEDAKSADAVAGRDDGMLGGIFKSVTGIWA
ncbi:Diphthamide biosynthesis protein 3 [Tulasnella sp. 427]|nr:Diphthamide biosynthesis protein 3 [Tulasnella sp. 427]